jgi:lipooligosaccharide transport system ATP-binding protein
MNCITGFYPATSGAVHIFDIDVHQNPREARMRLGVCAQEDTLDTDFTVFNQMVRYATYFRIPVDEGRRRTLNLLTRFGLDEKKDLMVEHLSGGMRRRLQVARALINEPQVLILDEPTTGLDPEVRRVLWEVIDEARSRNIAILLSTHYMDEAHRLCDRVAIMHQGKILAMAPPSVLIDEYLGKNEVEEEIRAGVVWKRPPNLEDVYLKVTGSRLGNDAA